MPAVAESTTRLYESIGRAFTKNDEANGWALLYFIDSLGSQEQDLEDIVRDSDDGIGWSILFDVDRIPDRHLEWLAQFVGVTCPPNYTAEMKRMCIEDSEGFKRGTRAALEDAVRKTLTGAQTVNVYERDGGAYQLRVQTYTVETPDEDMTEAAAFSQKPAGIILTYETISGGTYAELSAEFPGDYDALDTEFTDYDDMTSWMP